MTIEALGMTIEALGMTIEALGIVLIVWKFGHLKIH
jgi:hypothetical protein